MKEARRILFISQEISPYLIEETPIRLLNRQLPEFFQNNGFETRTFMPKFGEINERRNQLHEVIRLSGMNLIIEDTDHPLLIKVSSIQPARMQVYFIDNEDYFWHRKGISDDNGEYADNDERCVFFARGVLETVKKLRWTPDLIVCSGWMSALVPLYLKKVFYKTPFFEHSKVIFSLDDNAYHTPFGTKFANKILTEGMVSNDVRSIDGFPVGYEELMRLAVDHADGLIIAAPQVNQRVLNYAEMSSKKTLPFTNNNPESYLEFFNQLLQN